MSDDWSLEQIEAYKKEIYLEALKETYNQAWNEAIEEAAKEAEKIFGQDATEIRKLMK